MTSREKFQHPPTEHEAEKASNSYLMSLIAIMAGLPLPIVNLLATLIFYLGNRKGTYFVRWHCTQALLSQFGLLPFNSFGFWWSISIIFTDETLSYSYFGYMIFIFIFNLIEFIGTIYSAIEVRKGEQVEWWIISGITDRLCKP